MRVAYLSTDEVNRDGALRMARAQGLHLCPLRPEGSPPGGAFDGVVYDWDALPARWRQETLAGLLSVPAPSPVAVHSYGLDEHDAEALRRQGMAVFRCLQPELFWLLRLAAGVNRGEGDPDPAGANSEGSEGRLTRRLEELKQERMDHGRFPTPHISNDKPTFVPRDPPAQ